MAPKDLNPAVLISKAQPSILATREGGILHIRFPRPAGISASLPNIVRRSFFLRVPSGVRYTIPLLSARFPRPRASASFLSFRPICQRRRALVVAASTAICQRCPVSVPGTTLNLYAGLCSGRWKAL